MDLCRAHLRRDVALLQGACFRVNALMNADTAVPIHAQHAKGREQASSSSSETTVSAGFRAFLRSCEGYVLPETISVTAEHSTAEAALAESVNRV